MNLDKYGLPVQANGDANDQLQRCGMILTAASLEYGPSHEVDEKSVEYACAKAIGFTLQPKLGWFIRHVGGNTNNVSADQLISALCAQVAMENSKGVWNMFKACIRRFGFAQNYKDGLNGDSKTKIPDFMLLRALPLYLRVHALWYPLRVFADALLVIQALLACGPVWKDGGGFKKRDAGDVDDNNTILTLAVCRARMPTALSIIACKIYGKFRPWNYGCMQREITYADIFDPPHLEEEPYAFHPAYGALRWYHRAESGGNPEAAEMWRNICKRYFE